MRHVISDEIADFAAIFNNDIELVSVSRPETRLAEEMEQQLYRTCLLYTSDAADE